MQGEDSRKFYTGDSSSVAAVRLETLAVIICLFCYCAQLLIQRLNREKSKFQVAQCRILLLMS